MTRLIWIVAGCALLVWSGFAWLGHGLVEWIAAFAGNNAGELTLGPDLAALLVWLANLLAAAGSVVVVLIWLIGCAAIMILAAIASRLLARRTPGLKRSAYRLPPGRH